MSDGTVLPVTKLWLLNIRYNDNAFLSASLHYVSGECIERKVFNEEKITFDKLE